MRYVIGLHNDNSCGYTHLEEFERSCLPSSGDVMDFVLSRNVMVGNIELPKGTRIWGRVITVLHQTTSEASKLPVVIIQTLFDGPTRPIIYSVNYQFTEKFNNGRKP